MTQRPWAFKMLLRMEVVAVAFVLVTVVSERESVVSKFWEEESVYKIRG